MSKQTYISESTTYQGQFGEYTITSHDRIEVIIYRTGLMIAALCFGIGTAIVVWPADSVMSLSALTVLYACFWAALGVSLFTIHIYLAILHRLLQLFWLIGGIAAVVVMLNYSEPLAAAVYHHPQTLWGVGWTFVALSGIYFKEAFCFNRIETKLLTPIVPLLLLGYMAGFWSVMNQKFLLFFWAIQFMIFAIRKAFQALDPDIGDKSVFEYLRNQRSVEA
ncbi:MAG: DUF2301 domain-containing membrane protein [Microcoleaceae cyanobacterium]